MEEAKLPVVPGYRIIRRIGAGGMGAVYEAEKLATHQTFAVKVIRQEFAQDENHVARFLREVRALRDIRHPNVVDVFEWSVPKRDDRGLAFLVMELLKGETLQERLKRVSRLAPRPAVAVMLQVLDGLAGAHTIGVLHRDLGPANVFLVEQPDGKLDVRLLDFGLTRPLVGDDASNAVTQPGMMMGKPAYAAPELFDENPPGPEADLFACGMMLYRMLTGRFPYKQTTAQLLWVERFAERGEGKEYSSPLLYAPALPTELAEVVSRGIRKRPQDRYCSAREFQHALLAVEATLAQEPEPAGGPLPDAAPPRPVKLDASDTSVGSRTGTVEELAVATMRQRLRVPVLVGATVVLVLAIVLGVIFVAGDGATVRSGSEATTAPASPGPAAKEPTADARGPAAARDAADARPDAGPEAAPAAKAADAGAAPPPDVAGAPGPAAAPETIGGPVDGLEAGDGGRPEGGGATPGGPGSGTPQHGRRDGRTRGGRGERDGGDGSRLTGRADTSFVTTWEERP